MKRFIGGIMIGVLFQLLRPDQRSPKTMLEVAVYFVAVIIIGICFGLLVWGLWP